MPKDIENHPKINHSTRLRGGSKSDVALRILGVAPKVGEKAASHPSAGPYRYQNLER